MPQKSRYLEVVEWVKRGIEDGTLHYGDKLLSENELSEKFGMSRQTIRHATGVLEEEQLVTRVRGSGTYIGSSAPRERREVYKNIAVLSTFYESYIFPPTLRGIVRTLAKEGYTTQISFTDNRVDLEEQVLQSLLEKDNIDGLIVEPSKSALPNPNMKYFQELLGRQIPILSFNTSYPDLKVPCVRIDDRVIAYNATKYLIEKGHRRIAGIFKPDDGQGKLRYAGYMDALQEAGIHIVPKRTVWIDTVDMMNMEDVNEHLFHRIAECSAVLCYNDEVAVKTINMALERGINVPEDLSVVGIDNADMSLACRVPITTFDHPKEELGRKVGENMLKLINNPRADADYLFGAELIERTSVKNMN